MWLECYAKQHQDKHPCASLSTCLRRNAVQAYLAPQVKTPYPDASNGGDRSNQNENHRQSRSLSPAAEKRRQWCSPIRSPECPNSGTSVHRSDSAGAGASADSSSVALFEKKRVPPLLLAPAEWGIGLGGEWVSARGPQSIRGASSKTSKPKSSTPPIVNIASKESRFSTFVKRQAEGSFGEGRGQLGVM